ncbi:MAG: SDR family NAD(P)-dependent oxidoreductase [Deltaproteobacteria bacterium]|nr:SDR family NAD(P)-dependent oxidoreductase [Deltaproteobacteria bacterium]
MKLTESAAIVTGGASGLGEATVRHLVGNGGRAAIFDVQEEQGKNLVAELGKNAIFAHADVTSEQSILEAIERMVEKFGTFNVVVNCAGVVTPGKVVGRNGPLALDQYARVIQINLIGTFNVIRLAAARMVGNAPNAEGERGVIVNTASLAAFEGQIGQAAYASSKAGVVGLTLPIARELGGSGIRVMTIAPGLFETPMVDSLPEAAKEALAKMPVFPKRFGRPTEFALLVQQIVENPMLNGSVIRLDAGMRMAEK